MRYYNMKFGQSVTAKHSFVSARNLLVVLSILLLTGFSVRTFVSHSFFSQGPTTVSADDPGDGGTTSDGGSGGGGGDCCGGSSDSGSSDNNSNDSGDSGDSS